MIIYVHREIQYFPISQKWIHTHLIRWYGDCASCVVSFWASHRGEKKYKQWAKCLVVLYAKPPNKRFTIFHYKKNCYFAIGFYFFGKSIKKHPDSLCKNDNNNEENVCAYYIRVSNGMVAQKIKNRKLRIKKIGKIGNFALKNRRKIGKWKVLLSTKIASPHPVRLRVLRFYVHRI